MFIQILLLIIGFILLIKGADIFVDGASSTTKKSKVSKMLIGLTIVAFGTSLPELVTSIISSIKKEQDILVGNIIGSNIFNICIVLGLSVAIYGNLISTTFQMIDLITLLLMSIILYIISKINHYKITRSNGSILYMAYYTAIFVL